MRSEFIEPPRPAVQANRRRDPSLGIWLLAAISLLLPWIGVPIALWGALAVAKTWPYGWACVAAGMGLVVLDVLIDFVWAAQLAGRTDEPTLNRGGTSLLGRVAGVVIPIENGRGRVRIGDSEWIAEGPDAAMDEGVVVLGVKGTVLEVGPIPKDQPLPSPKGASPP
jgi:hypothetical protein